MFSETVYFQWNILDTSAPWYQLELIPSEIGRLCAEHFWRVSHDSNGISDRRGIELCSVSFRSWFKITYTMGTPTHFENPYGYHNVRNQIIFHLRYFRSTNAITRLRKIEKKTLKPVSGTFLKANFSKNEKFIENKIDCDSFYIMRLQEANLGLRKLFSNDFPIS